MSLILGGRTVDRTAAIDYARGYLTRGRGFAYPSYDGFESERAQGPLTDADFLAPVLLNVPHLSVGTYEALQAERHWLDTRLASVPHDLDLADAELDQLTGVAELFSVLDHRGISGARGTVLAKVLHRKRPRLIPLYDKRVRSVYQEARGRLPAPVPRQRGRSWQDFFVLFLQAVQHDLRRELNLWEEIAAMAVDPPITPLRALDIVAWWAGSN